MIPEKFTWAGWELNGQLDSPYKNRHLLMPRKEDLWMLKQMCDELTDLAREYDLAAMHQIYVKFCLRKDQVAVLSYVGHTATGERESLEDVPCRQYRANYNRMFRFLVASLMLGEEAFQMIYDLHTAFHDEGVYLSDSPRVLELPNSDMPDKS